MSSRQASHAGSWYLKSGKALDSQLGGWLDDVAPPQSTGARAIISPHAGYSYCGACAAYAYKQIVPDNIKRVFILGPSHHYYLDNCALSPVTLYETPLYDLHIDQEIYEELHRTRMFQEMSLKVDEAEHSIEMQLPYVAKVMESRKNQFKIVPVMVGNLNKEAERNFGKVFSKYLLDPANVFVISSDFCHWGSRFGFQHYDKKQGAIYKSIEALDRQGMRLIENLDPSGFYKYLKEFRNTICGRHPIAVMLNAVDHLLKEAKNGLRLEFRFLDYRQSNHCKNARDSSVSYAAGFLSQTHS